MTAARLKEARRAPATVTGLLLVALMGTNPASATTLPGDEPQLTVVSCLVNLEHVQPLEGVLASSSDACDADGNIVAQYLEVVMDSLPKKVICRDGGNCMTDADTDISCSGFDYAMVATYSGGSAVGILECIDETGTLPDAPEGVPHVLACSAIGRYFELQPGDGSSCGPLDEPFAQARAYYGGLDNYVCSGTRWDSQTLTGSTEVSGGLFIEATVGLSVTTAVETGWEFTCDFDQVGWGAGGGGVLRECQLETYDGKTDSWERHGEPIPYEGVQDGGCTYDAVEVWHGTVAGHGTSVGLAHRFPQSTLIAPSDGSPYQSLRLVNRPLLPGVGPVTSDASGWNEEEFGIHYLDA